jgi:hypothetical protein
MAQVDIRIGYKDSAWFTANATLVLKQGQQVHLLQTGQYKIGDGVTQLSALNFLGGGGTQDLQDVTDNGNVTTNAITVDALAFDLTPTNAPSQGQIAYNGQTGALAYLLNNSNVMSNIGQTLHAYVHNADSVTILKGQPVYLFSASGNKASVKLAYNTSDATSAKTLGLAAENINAGNNGMITCQGVLDGLNTGLYNAGDSLYLGATAGTLTSSKPYAPNHVVSIGIVEKANNGAGQIYVRIQNGFELDEIHNVDLISVAPVNNDVLTYESSTSLWKNKTVATALGFTPENITNKSSSYTSSSTTTYANTKALVDGLATKENSLGFTPENVANKENTTLDTSTTKYPTNNLVKTNIDAKVTANAAITGATKTKITYDSKGLVTSGADATTADIADSVDKRYVTDANLTVIGNTSGTNTGNETTSTIGTLVNGSSTATPNDADLVMTVESSVAKKNTWTQIKAFLKTYFDTIYQAAGSYLTSANITQVITNGVTDKAPSEDAVFDALATKQGTLTLTTTGTSGVATLSGGTLNIPKYVDGDWVDYSATSTIVGWSSFTTKVIKYRVIGKQVFVNFYIEGISNSTSTTFTLPNTALYGSINYLRLANNGVISESFFRIISSSSTVTFFTTVVSSTWTASGTKTILGQFFYEID